MKRIIVAVIVLVAGVSGWSQDRHFAWSYNSPTLAKGAVDLEVWNTYSAGRKGYDFGMLKQRVELEFGVTDRIQTSFYINGKHTHSGPRDTSDLSTKSSSTISFSNAWKFYILDPYTHALGLSAYLEYYLVQGEIELEGKLMVDKITEKNWFVFNSTFATGLEREYMIRNSQLVGEIGKEMKWENTLGYQYHPKPALGIGIEARNVNVIDEGVWEYSALYAGPSVFYSSGNYFLIFNIMPQLINLAGEERPLDLVHQEKFQFRTLAGIRF